MGYESGHTAISLGHVDQKLSSLFCLSPQNLLTGWKAAGVKPTFADTLGKDHADTAYPEIFLTQPPLRLSLHRLELHCHPVVLPGQPLPIFPHRHFSHTSLTGLILSWSLLFRGPKLTALECPIFWSCPCAFLWCHESCLSPLWLFLLMEVSSRGLFRFRFKFGELREQAPSQVVLCTFSCILERRSQSPHGRDPLNCLVPNSPQGQFVQSPYIMVVGSPSILPVCTTTTSFYVFFQT